MSGLDLLPFVGFLIGGCALPIAADRKRSDGEGLFGLGLAIVAYGIFIVHGTISIVHGGGRYGFDIFLGVALAVLALALWLWFD